MSDEPRSASARALMVGALPPIYRDVPADGGRPLVERWLSALEEVLDPIVALLDNLPAHLDPELAPDPLVELMYGWIGMPPSAALEIAAKRRLLADAARIADERGTEAGLKRVLALAFPGERLDVFHSGAITTGADARETVGAALPQLEVHSARPLGPDERLALLDLVEDQRPAHVAFRLVEGAAGAPAPEPEAASP